MGPRLNTHYDPFTWKTQIFSNDENMSLLGQGIVIDIFEKFLIAEKIKIYDDHTVFLL